MKNLNVKLSEKQVAALTQWANVCRATPEETLLALAMQNLRMIDDGSCSHEDNLANTVSSLREYVDRGANPIKSDGVVMAV